MGFFRKLRCYIYITCEKDIYMDRTVQEDKINEYYTMIYRFSFMHLKNLHDAEDVTQEVFYKYLTKSPAFECKQKEKAWLFQVAMNMCRNYWTI